MSIDKDYSQELIKLFLPTEIFDFFEIINIQIETESVNVFLDEINMIPPELSHEKLTSKGFHEIAIIQDFPIRKKAVYLHVRRRRWHVESSNKIISRDWNMVAKGTRFTSEFATFLKGLFGHLPDKF